ncbi:hypothetical protein MIR68_004564 [Amoeboaphelidium protococcarum]|nr:hypothetical protein MIR68_004564 [Amoeboaphelidium protococcarum]
MLKEKVVTLYEKLLEQDARDGDFNYDDMLLCPPNIEALQNLIMKKFNSQSVLKSRFIHNFIWKCISKFDHHYSPLCVHSVQTVIGLLECVKSFKFHHFNYVIQVIFDTDNLSQEVTQLLEAVNRYIIREKQLYHNASELLLAILTLTPNQNENIIIQAMISAPNTELIVEALKLICLERADQIEQIDQIRWLSLVGLLMQFRADEERNQLRDYLFSKDIESLYESILSLTLGAFSLICTGKSLNGSDADLSVQNTNQSSPAVSPLSPVVEGITGFIGRIIPVFAPPSVDYKDAFGGSTSDWWFSSSLLVVYELLHSQNQYFIQRLQQSDNQLEDFIRRFCNYNKFTYKKGEIGKLNILFIRNLCRHRQLLKPQVIVSVFDALKLYLKSFNKKRLQLQTQKVALESFLCVLCQLKNVRLQYDWLSLYSTVSKFLQIAVQIDKIDQDILVLAVQILDYILTHGDSFLPDSISYDGLYYEIIRMGTLYRKVANLLTSTNPVGGIVNINGGQGGGTCKNIIAILDYYEPLVANKSSSASDGGVTEQDIYNVIQSNYDGVSLVQQPQVLQYTRYVETQYSTLLKSYVRYIITMKHS